MPTNYCDFCVARFFLFLCPFCCPSKNFGKSKNQHKNDHNFFPYIFECPKLTKKRQFDRGGNIWMPTKYCGFFVLRDFFSFLFPFCSASEIFVNRKINTRKITIFSPLFFCVQNWRRKDNLTEVGTFEYQRNTVTLCCVFFFSFLFPFCSPIFWSLNPLLKHLRQCSRSLSWQFCLFGSYSKAQNEDIGDNVFRRWLNKHQLMLYNRNIFFEQFWISQPLTQTSF